MALQTHLRPAWYGMSHHDRYRRLQKVRRVSGRCHYGKQQDCWGRIVPLDGSVTSDVPSFYLALGEAVNGPNGYFGACLDALSDCLSGNFGVLPPLTIQLSHFDQVRAALDGRAWCRFHAEHVFQYLSKGDELRSLVDAGYLGDGSDVDIARWTVLYQAALAGEPFADDGFDSYFDAIIDVLEHGGAKLIPANEAGH